MHVCECQTAVLLRASALCEAISAEKRCKEDRSNVSGNAFRQRCVSHALDAVAICCRVVFVPPCMHDIPNKETHRNHRPHSHVAEADSHSLCCAQGAVRPMALSEIRSYHPH